MESGGHWRGVLNNFFLSRKSPNTISCGIFSTQHKKSMREELTFHQINIF